MHFSFVKNCAFNLDVCSNYLLALPSNLTIENKTDKDTIIGKEHHTVKLDCKVESGMPPETIIWKRDRESVKTGGPKRNVYEFQADRTYHNSNFTCEVTNNLTKMPLTKTVKLDIQCNYMYNFNSK